MLGLSKIKDKLQHENLREKYISITKKTYYWAEVLILDSASYSAFLENVSFIPGSDHRDLNIQKD